MAAVPGEYVERNSGKPAAVQRLEQCVEIDQPTPGGIHQVGPAGHPPEEIGSYQSRVVSVKGRCSVIAELRANRSSRLSRSSLFGQSLSVR